MRTAIDTNILSSIWSQEPGAEALTEQLEEAKSEGALLIAPVVYIELLAHPRVDESFVNSFLANTDITITFQLKEKVWVEAGRRFAQYASRRRESSHGTPRSLPADFLIGAHALLQADRLISLDRKRYVQDFPDLYLLQAAGEEA